MTPRKTRRALDVLMVAVATAALAAVAYSSLSGLAWDGSGEPVGGQRQATTESTTAAAGQYDLDRIVSAHLFGEPDQQKPADVVNAPETKLQLRLMGMIASANDQYARALIGVNAREVNAYGVGESVEGTDAQIRSVEPRRVLLNRNGAVESLYLKLPSVAGGTPDYRPPATGNTDEAAGAQAMDSSNEPSQFSDEEAGSENEIPYTGVREAAGRQNKLPF